MQYFLKRANITEDLILQICELLKLSIHYTWTIDNIAIDNVSSFIDIVQPLYRPCFAKRFVAPVLEDPRSHIIIILRHLIQYEGTYQLLSKERYKAGIGRFTEYHISLQNMILNEPVQLNFDDKE